MPPMSRSLLTIPRYPARKPARFSPSSLTRAIRFWKHSDTSFLAICAVGPGEAAWLFVPRAPAASARARAGRRSSDYLLQLPLFRDLRNLGLLLECGTARRASVCATSAKKAWIVAWSPYSKHDVLCTDGMNSRNRSDICATLARIPDSNR